MLQENVLAGSNREMKKEIAIISENNPVYSGGRYYMWMLAKAMAEAGFNLTFYTNRPPCFLNDFDLYDGLDVNLRSIQKVEEYADLYIGSPVHGNVKITELADHHRKPSFCVIFDPMPLIERFVPQDFDMEDAYFRPMVNPVRNSDCKVIVISKYARMVTAQWLRKRPQDIEVIYPRINSRAMQKVKDGKRKKWVVAVSRVVGRKNWKDALEAFTYLPKGWEFHLFTSTNLGELPYLIEHLGIKDRVFFHTSLNDYDKFYFFKQARIMLSSSLFEGFGIPMVEGRALGMPFVGYDYPIFRETYDDEGMFLAERENVLDLGEKLVAASKIKEPLEPKTDFYFEHMIEDVKRVFGDWL